MSGIFLCSFPELHSMLRPELAAWTVCRPLDIGLPPSMTNNDTQTMASAYPFSPKEAAQCLQDMRTLESAALSGVPLQALSHMQGNAGATRQAAEIADLRHFSHTGECANHGGEAARQNCIRAQKILLWAWLLEERVLELQKLAQTCSSNSLLAPALGEDDDLEIINLSVNLGMGVFSVDEGLMPPWRIVLEQASFFIPEDAVLVINTRMAEDMADILTFTPMPIDLAKQLNLPAQLACRMVHAPVWQALGRAVAVPGCPQWNKSYTFCVLEAAL